MSEELMKCPFCGRWVPININECNTRPIEDALRSKLDIAVEGMKKAQGLLDYKLWVDANVVLFDTQEAINKLEK